MVIDAILKAEKIEKAEAIGVIGSLYFKAREIDAANIAPNIKGAMGLLKAGLGNSTINSSISIVEGYIANTFGLAIGWLGNIEETF